MKITALVENQSNCDLKPVHGLALYIETKKHIDCFLYTMTLCYLFSCDCGNGCLDKYEVCYFSVFSSQNFISQ